MGKSRASSGIKGWSEKEQVLSISCSAGSHSSLYPTNTQYAMRAQLHIGRDPKGRTDSDHAVLSMQLALRRCDRSTILY